MTAAAPDTAARFRALAEATVEDLLRMSPERATDLGDHRYDSRLDDLSEPGLAERRRLLARRRDELDSLDADDLDRADAVDAEILRAALDREVFALDRLAEHRWNPLVWLPGEALYPLLARDTVPVPERLRALAGRLAAVPDRLAAARATLADMPRVHVETAVGQTAGVLALVRDEVPALLARAPGLAGELEPPRRDALRALEQHRDWLAGQEGSAAGDPRLGPELFAAKLHLELDADLPAERVVALARERLAELAEELRAVATDWVGAGDDPVRRGAGAVRGGGADRRHDRAAGPAGAGRDDRACPRPRDRPGAGRARRGARDAGVPPRRRDRLLRRARAAGDRAGRRTTRSPDPGGLAGASGSPRSTASTTRQHARHLTVHEAMPGHLLQLAHARAYRGATRVRAVLAERPVRRGLGGVRRGAHGQARLRRAGRSGCSG